VANPGGEEQKNPEARNLPDNTKFRKRYGIGLIATLLLSTLSWRFALVIKGHKIDCQGR
jgi:hypothetical protein